MDLLIKCVSLATVSTLVVLMIRRQNPELSFAVTTVTAVVLLLSFSPLLKELLHSFREVERVFGNSAVQAKPMLKCLGIALISRFGSDLCRDASQSALASAVETAGNLCAAAVAMPVILSLMTMIGGML